MKKLLSLLLCGLLLLTFLTACDNNGIENTSDGESSAQTTSIETSEEIKIPENVVYFTGQYKYSEVGELLFSKSDLYENYSHFNGSLRGYLNPQDSYLNKAEEVPDDTYFLIGISVFSQDSQSGLSSTDKELLANNGFIEIENHPMIYNPNISEELLVLTDRLTNENRMEELEEAQKEIEMKYIRQMLPDVEDISYGSAHKILFCRFYAVGYISFGGLKALSKEELNGLRITWFPEPNDTERWLNWAEGW